MTWVATNTVVTTDNWSTADNWRDGAGAAPSVAPGILPGNYVIRYLEPFPTQGSWVAGQRHTKIITTGANDGSGESSVIPATSVNPSVYAFSGEDSTISHRYVIHNGPYNGSAYTFPFVRAFQIFNPNDFFGILHSDAPNRFWVLKAENDFTPIVYGINTTYGPRVSVPTAGTVAKIEGVSPRGMLHKEGEGTLEVMGGGGAETHYNVHAGTLRLDGEGEFEQNLVEDLFAAALIHLDASAADTLVLSNDGVRAWVTQWNDVRKNGLCARPDPNPNPDSTVFINEPRPPYLSDQVSPTDLQLVDFGVAKAEAKEGDVHGCYLCLSENFSNVRDAVFVVAYPYGPQWATVLGHESYYDWMSDNTYGGIFSCGYAPYAVAYGKFALNGGPVTYDDLHDYGSNSWQRVNVVHAMPTADTHVNLLGTDRKYISNNGRSRLGEVLLFSRELSREERVAIDRYLVHKWIDATRSTAEGIYAANGVNLDVPEGRIARVANLGCHTNETEMTITKTGAGTLELGGIDAPGLELNILGGGIRFAALNVSTVSPGGTPYLWLDATKDATIDVETKGVTTWRDCRANVALSATAASLTKGGTLPTRISDDCNGLQTLDFGTGGNDAGTQSYMKLPEESSSRVTYAGFMVTRFLDARHFFMFGGGSSMDFFRNTGMIGLGDSLTGSTYIQQLSPAAYWTLNGVPADTYVEYPILLQTNDYFVIAFKSAKPMILDRLAVDRDSIGSCGNVRIGEVIVYHEPISAAEFRQTEAYLMKKWLNRDHPAIVSTIGGIQYPTGADMIVDTDRDLALSSLTGGNDQVIKRGEGAVTLSLNPMLTDSAPSVSVEGGSFTIKNVFPPDECEVLHLDASDLSSLTYTVSSAGTNVTYIADQNNANLKARSMYGVDSVVNRHPSLELVATKKGVYRQVLNFFETQYTADTVKRDNSGMQLELNGVFSPVKNVREVFMVVAQNQDTSGLQINSWFSADYTSALAWGRNYRQLSAPLIYDHATYTKAGFREFGSAAIDGVSGIATTMTFGSSDGFKLIELVPGENNPIGLISMERKGYAAGGYKFGEIIAFSRELTDEEREFLRQRLRAKWFDDVEPPVIPAPEYINVVAGTQVNYAGSPLPPLPITVTVPDGIAEGRYTLVESANGFTVSDVDVWKAQLTIDNRTSFIPNLLIDGNRLVLVLEKCGFFFIFH